MKILILIETTSLGGHVISAFTTGKELKKRGHDVHFAADKGILSEQIKKQFPFYNLSFYHYHYYRESYFTFKSFYTCYQLSKLIEKEQFDHIHAFDARSYIIASIVSVIKKIAITCTLCGSRSPYYDIPRSEKIIVFSFEQKTKLVKQYKWKEKNISVISTRLDMEQFFRLKNREIKNLYEQYKINPDQKNVMMITTFLTPKKEAILNVLNAARLFLKLSDDIKLILVGGRGEFFNSAVEIGKKINEELNRNALIFTGTVVNAYRLLEASYVVIGVGRSAFEGMAFKKPTLIVGKYGYAGTVLPETTKKLSYFNFSGRNIRGRVPSDVLAEEIIRLLSDKDYYDKSKNCGYDFLIKNIDIKSGIKLIERVYLENSKDEFSYKESLFKLLDITRILIPIIFDNYYNYIKSLLSFEAKDKIKNQKFS